MRIEDRLNVAQFGWAGGWRNMAFIAGRVHRHASNNKVFMIQQTPLVAQSIPFITDPPLADMFVDGSYVSVFARVRGRTTVDDKDQPVDAVVAPVHLHTRFVNGLEMDPDAAHSRLMAFINRVPKDAKVDTTLRGMTVDTPPEVASMLPSDRHEEAAADDPYALNKRDNRLIRNGNHVQISGVIGYIEYRDGGADPSQNRTQIFVQQNALLSEAIPVRIYGKQAAHVAEVFSPGHTVYVSGELHCDVKKQESGGLRVTPYIKTYSVEPAQQTHIRFRADGLAYPEWALELYRLCNSRDSSSKAEQAKRMRLVQAKPRTEAVQSNEGAQ